MRKILETAVILLGTMGWWGFVYPELCLLDTAYEEEYDEAEDFGIIVKVPSAELGDISYKEVRIKSKIAEYVYQVRNREAEKENQDDE